ncbi:MliC family protein [Mesorhizobium sp. KR1-2]|uniref:MliC family protein n=1 Tax=Mesorhizobium sp. KR1-2 TaxID=3156609 RepID=UPI0032B3BFA3
MQRFRVFTILLASCIVSSAGYAQEVQPRITLSIEASAEAQIRSLTYKCGKDAPLSVSYVNADPNFLAIVPIDGKSIVFASAISGSGARYTSGKYEWWTKGDEAFLRDLTGDENGELVLECKVSPS